MEIFFPNPVPLPSMVVSMLKLPRTSATEKRGVPLTDNVGRKELDSNAMLLAFVNDGTVRCDGLQNMSVPDLGGWKVYGSAAHRCQLFIVSQLLALGVVEVRVVVVDWTICGASCCVRKLLCVGGLPEVSSHEQQSQRGFLDSQDAHRWSGHPVRSSSSHRRTL